MNTLYAPWTSSDQIIDICLERYVTMTYIYGMITLLLLGYIRTLHI